MKILFTLSVPSTAFMKSAEFSMLLQRKCSLEYFYEGEEDYSAIFEKLIFDGVESFKCTYYEAGSFEMTEAYDKVVDVGNSFWLTEIKHNLSKAKSNSGNLRHLRIYFDDGPCYEFICKSFEVVTENRKDYFKDPNNSV